MKPTYAWFEMCQHANKPEKVAWQDNAGEGKKLLKNQAASKLNI